jgi:hypothetical protein
MSVMMGKQVEQRFQGLFIKATSMGFSGVCQVLLPIMPLIISLLLMDTKYIQHYKTYMVRFKRHFNALKQGPVQHYLSDVLLKYQDIPVTIEGECVQCGNCCLNKQCAFLEPVGDNKYQCGIYTSTLRRYSNCNSFPLHAQDIERYACPSYKVVNTPAAIWLKPVN